MPEALAVVVVFVITVVAWVGAWMNARNPANNDARDELARLRHHAAWLEQRLEIAQREKWGEDMVGNISDEMAVTSAQLEQAAARTKNSSM